MRFTAPTACDDVSPSGLSRMIHPFMGGGSTSIPTPGGVAAQGFAGASLFGWTILRFLLLSSFGGGSLLTKLGSAHRCPRTMMLPNRSKVSGPRDRQSVV